MQISASLPMVANRYELVRKIGSGGMGGIWLARDSSLDRQCAVKLLDAVHLGDDEVVTRFQNEARSTACIRSPHVVEVFDHGTWCGIPFIVMEYLEGEDLGTRLQRVGQLDLVSTYEIVKQLACGVSSAHAAGVVHRDLKPSNVLLVQVAGREVAKIIDFGIANNSRIAGSTVVRGVLLGTPEYMSPEQARGLPIDARTDVFSLGVLAYECVSGQTPSDRELGSNDAPHESVPRLFGSVRGVPAAFDSWVARALARDRERRFQSATELADAFGKVLEANGLQSNAPEGNGSLAPVLVSTALARVHALNDALVLPRTCSGKVEATPARCAPAPVRQRSALRRKRSWSRAAALLLPSVLAAFALAVSSLPSNAFRSLVAASADAASTGFASVIQPAGDLSASFTAEGSGTPRCTAEPIVTPDPRPIDSLESLAGRSRLSARERSLHRRAQLARPQEGFDSAEADSTAPRGALAADTGLTEKLTALRRNVVVSYSRARLEFSIPMFAATPTATESVDGAPWSASVPAF